jgi:hypothetical protein
VPLEPPDANGRAINFNHMNRRKRMRADILDARNTLSR